MSLFKRFKLGVNAVVLRYPEAAAEFVCPIAAYFLNGTVGHCSLCGEQSAVVISDGIADRVAVFIG